MGSILLKIILLILSVEDRSEEDAHDGDEESDGEGGGEPTDSR